MKSLRSKPRLNVGCFLFSLAVLLLALSGAQAGSVKIVPDDTINVAGGPWFVSPACGGGNCQLTYVTDGVDGNYVWSVDGLSQLYSFANTSGIPGTATIDSFVVWFRCANNDVAGSDRVRPRIRSTGTTNYSDTGKGGTIANMNIETTTFADSSKTFNGFPDAAASGDSPLTIARMDSLEVQILDVVGDTNKVTACSVVVCYTETGGTVKGRRRHLLSDEGGYEKFAEYCLLDPNWIIGFREPEFLWREE